MNEFLIPDAIGEPFEGWRTWYVVPRDKSNGPLVLRSFVYSHVWEPGEAIEAECRAHSTNHSWRDTPGDNCECGIYGLHDPEGLDKYYRNRNYQSGSWREVYRVQGKIAMWGKVIPGEVGVRAQYAYPIYIEIPKRIKNSQKGREPLLSAEEVALNLGNAYQCETMITDEIRLRGDL